MLVASLVLINRSQTRRLEAEIGRQLEVTTRVFGNIVASRERQLSTALRLLSGDFAFKQSMATGDAATIESNLRSLQERIGADSVWVTDDAGALLADLMHEMETGESLEDLPVIGSALDEEAAAAIVSLHGRPYQLAAVPVFAPDLIGVLAAGFRIDDAFAVQLASATDSDVSIAAEGEIFASSLQAGRRASLGEYAGGPTREGLGMVGPEGARDIVLRKPVSGRGEVIAYVQRPWDEALRPLRELQRLVFWVGLAGILLTLAAGFLIARGITLPVERLADATRRVVAGEYGTRVTVARRDEIGGLADSFNRMVEGLRDKERYRSVLNKAVSKEIAEELLRRGEIQLGGEERDVTILFSDIRSFTTISEGLEPADLVAQLNEYFSRMGKAIESRRGVIDKYVGDAIMALFGAPVDSPEDAANAQRASLDMLAALEGLNAERRARGLPPWRIGVGLNTGRAVAGNLGTETRSSYTVIGDAVNLASRLEGLTKHYGAKVIVSRAVRDAGGDGFHYRPLDLVRVKGKLEPVEIFELLGEGGAAPAWVAPFEEAVEAYRRRAFQDADRLFVRVLESRPDDLAVSLYLERIAPLLKGVPDDWDPAHTMTEK